MKKIISWVKNLKISPLVLVFFLFSASTLFAANAITYPKYTIGSGDGTGFQAFVDATGHLLTTGTFTGTVVATTASVGLNNATAPTSSDQIGTQDGTGKLQAVSSSNPVPTSVASLPLPSGASTSALQTTGNTSLSTIASSILSQGSTTSGQSGPLAQGAVTTAAPTYTTGQTSPLSLTTGGALRVDASSSTQPVSGTVTANQGGAPWSQNITQVGGSSVTLGQKTSANSIPVVIGSDNNVNTVAAQAARTTGNITGNAQCITVAATQYSVATIDLTGTYAGITVSFSASTNGGSVYLPVLASNASSSNTAATTAALTNNSSNLFNVTLPGVTNFEVCSTAYTSGTLAVGITPTADPMVFNVAAGIVGTPTVQGAKTNNGAAPGTNLLGAVVGLANAAQPLWTEGNNVMLSTLLNGNLRTDTSSYGGTAVVTGGVAGAEGVGGLAANNATQSGNPLNIGATAINAAPTVATNGQNAQVNADLEHYLLVRPYANKENVITSCVTATTATNTSVIAAQGAGIKIYLLAYSFSNSGSTGDVPTFTSGSGGTTIWSAPNPPTFGGALQTLPMALPTAANAALFVNTGAASTTEKICALAYTGS